MIGKTKSGINTGLAIVFLLLGLPACAERDVFTVLNSGSYIRDQKEIVEAANWNTVKASEIDIRQNEFCLTIIHLLQGEPYIMLVENRDDVLHILVVEDFFKTIALRKIVTEKEEISGINLVGLNLNAGEVKEVHFVPVRDGRFKFEGGQGAGIFATNLYFSPLSRDAVKGMVGSFVVEE